MSLLSLRIKRCVQSILFAATLRYNDSLCKTIATKSSNEKIAVKILVKEFVTETIRYRDWL